MKLSDKITIIPGVGEQTAKLLGLLGVKTIKDLLLFLPHRIEDRSNVVAINKLRFGQDSVIVGHIRNVHSRRTRKGSLLIEAKISDQSGEIGAIWFNQRFVLSQLTIGREIMLFGSKKIAPTIGNPFVVKKIISQAEYTPIYPLTKGLHQGHISRMIRTALPLVDKIADILPPKIIEQFQLPHRHQALLAVHRPTRTADLERAQELLAFEELLGLAIAVELSRGQRQKISTQPLSVDKDFLKEFVASLPFQLTVGQKKAAWQIIQNLAKDYPTHQLLYGEVGSGKTIVSLIAALTVVKNGQRCLFLVPTVTLASQQLKAIKNFVGDDIKVSQIIGSIKESTDADIIIGTHAVLNKANELEEVGLVVIDEQQRFGVRQRQELSLHHPKAHLLMTTATPIPRSLAQTILGNLNITYLTDKPPHQKNITTVCFTPDDRSKTINNVKQQLTKGQPGYVICPAIEETEPDQLFVEAELKSVNNEVKRLAKEFPQNSIAALHGKLPAKDKTKILHQFLDGTIDILVATTVVEVGIDNPKATWMIIENAEMFGLSTLHQLRGRIGRGNLPSTCYLSRTSLDELAQRRLELLEKSTDGLSLAEADLALRGPGDILGSEQSGLPGLKYANLSNRDLVEKVFALARKIVDDGLEKYPTLKPIIKEVDGLAAS